MADPASKPAPKPTAPAVPSSTPTQPGPATAAPASVPTPAPVTNPGPDGRARTSAENGKKGGRPVSEATLRAQAAREYISSEMEKSLAPIVAKAINDAILGNSDARNWLSDRGWGKAALNLGVDAEGKALTVVFDNAFASSTEGDSGE